MMKMKAAKMAAWEIFKSHSLCVLCVLLRGSPLFSMESGKRLLAGDGLTPALT
jgi:hypothetical protein